MTLSKPRIALVCALIAVAATALLGLQHRSLNQVRDDNSRLRNEIADLDLAHQKKDSIPKPNPDSKSADSLTDEELSELLRLRAEATRLRSR